MSEHAVARMGRVGCGVLCQVRELLVGWSVASGRMEDMIEIVDDAE